MPVRWTEPAAGDLVRIVEHIRADSPAAAQRVAQTIFKAVAGLSRFPYRGRKGAVVGTRELIFVPWPYIVVYEVLEQEVRVLRVRHAAQNWP